MQRIISERRREQIFRISEIIFDFISKCLYMYKLKFGHKQHAIKKILT